MKPIRLVGLVLLALCIVSAVASATTSAALPEFLPGTGVALKGTSGKAFLETLSTKTKLECTSATGTGEITGAKTVSKIKFAFTGCKSAGFPCKTATAGKEELVTNELTGTLGYISTATKEVGILLKPTIGKEFLEFECVGGIVKVKVLGLAICPITPINTSTTTFTMNCRQKAGDQEPTKFEGGEKEVLLMSINGGSEETAGETDAATITGTASVTIMA